MICCPADSTPPKWSSDGVNWTSSANIPGSSYGFNDILHYGGSFYLARVMNQVVRSTDGINATQAISSLGFLGCLALYKNGGAASPDNLIIAGNDGFIEKNTLILGSPTSIFAGSSGTTMSNYAACNSSNYSEVLFTNYGGYVKIYKNDVLSSAVNVCAPTPLTGGFINA